MMQLGRATRRDLMRHLAGGTLLAVTGCADHAADPSAGHVRVAPGLVLTMPAPGSLNRRIDAFQLVTARHGSRTIAFEARIQASGDSVDLRCIDALGREAMRIRWTNTGIVSEKAQWVPDDLHPDNMLADIIMLYWPASVVGQALAASSGTLEITPGTRSVRLGGVEVIHADFQMAPNDDPWNGRVRYRNLPWDYALDVQSRVIGP